MNPRKGKKTTECKAPSALSSTRLAEMIEEATVDAHDESEQAMGWFTMLEEYLELPFETEVLGVSVRVTRIDHRDDDRLVAICARGRDEQAIGLADLPLPTPMPAGRAWIDAYRRWSARR
jgi:hypothetical protein